MTGWFDLKYAVRLLLRSPGHSLLSICIVALSVGLAVWCSCVVYSLALRPLGFPGSEHWYSIKVAADTTERARPHVDAYTLQELLRRNRTADYLGSFSTHSAVLSEGQASTSLRAATISPRLMSALGSAPVLGRLFDDSDAQPGAAPAALISFDTWKNAFAGDPGIIGKQTRIDAQPVQIVGVMPKELLAFQDFELWLPLQPANLPKPADSSVDFTSFIVLGPHQRLDVVLKEMQASVDWVNRAYPDLFKAGRHVKLVPANRVYTSDGEVQVASLCSVMAGGVFLLGCVNISLMFIARLLERSRELALRTALGASRGRLVRQCLLETAFVVLLGLMAAWGLAELGILWTHDFSDFLGQVLATGRDDSLPQLRPVNLLAGLLGAIGIWLLSTLIPAVRVAKQDAALVLAGSGKGMALRGSAKTASLLVGLQILISCLVLVICSNLVLAVYQESNKPTGIDDSHIMLSTYPTEFGPRYPRARERLQFWDDLTARVEAQMPGAGVAYTTSVPTDPAKVPVVLETQEGTAASTAALSLPLVTVSENYFPVLGITLRAGRLLDSTDNSSSLDVAVIDERLAARYWPGQSVLGKRFQPNPGGKAPWVTLVGVVSAVAAEDGVPDTGLLYRSLRQVAPPQFQLMVKLPPGAANPRAALRAAAYAVDRDLPLHNLQMLTDYLQADNRNYTGLVPVFTTFALITAVLAATGVFGLISRSVAQRTQEVGIRRALGATQWQAISIFLRQGALYLSIGVVGGCLGILAMNALTSTFDNILNHAISVSSGVFVLMAAVIFIASYVPSRRAVALEPGDALRYE
jgi:predicted permease